MGLLLGGGIAEDNRIWMIATEWSLLCCLELEGKEFKIITSLSEKELLFVPSQYSSMIKVDNRLFFYPDLAEDIVVFHMESYKLIRININFDKYKNKFGNNSKIGSGILIENNLFFIGNAYPIIIKLNVQTLEYNILELDLTSAINKQDRQIIFGKNIRVFNNKIYIPILNYPAIIVYDIILDESCWIEYKKEDRSILGVEVIENEIWIVSASNHEIFVHKHGYKKEYCIQKKPKGLNNIQDLYWISKLIYQNKLLWVFPGFGTELFSFKVMEKEIRTIKKFDENMVYKYGFVDKLDEKHLYAIFGQGEYLEIIDTVNKNITRIPIPIPKNMKEYLETIDKTKLFGKIVKEQTMALACFLKIIENDNMTKRKEKLEVGKKIYEECNNNYYV